MRWIDELAREARERAAAMPSIEPGSHSAAPSLKEALGDKSRLSVIAEFKRASPSQGVIAERDLKEVVAAYHLAGATALSVLTEPNHFRGCLSDLEQAAKMVSIPVLMKDFIVDPVQIQTAARVGARGVLLIVRILSSSQLGELVDAARSYGLSALVECHGREELDRAAEYEDVILGVNNRDLDTFEIDRSLAKELLRELPESRISVAESGYKTPEHTRGLSGVANAVLIGTALMKQQNPSQFIEDIGSLPPS